MKPNIAVVLALASSLSLAACAKRDAAQAGPAAAAMGGAADAQAAGRAKVEADGRLPSASRALRITTETSVVVKDLDAALLQLRSATAESGGYVGEAHVAGNAESRTGSLELHVPAAQLGAFRARVGQLGDIVSDSEKAEDVTEQRADVAARLANARAEEKRLLTLLSEKTGSLADVVAVEKEIAAVRETIERMDAQQRVLEGQIAFATVRVQLTTRYVAHAVGPLARIGHAAGEGVDAAGTFVVTAAVVTVEAGPTLGILGAMAYGIYRIVRALRRRRAVRLAAA